MPTRRAATKAPRIEPMPPITMTTKAEMRTLSPIPDSTVKIGPAMQKIGDPHVERGRPEEDAHHLVEEENEAEGRQHLIEMVAPIEPAEDDDLDRNPDEDRRGERGAKPDHERPGGGEDGGRNI